MTDLISQTLDQCRIVEKIGEGGMATIYKLQGLPPRPRPLRGGESKMAQALTRAYASNAGTKELTLPVLNIMMSVYFTAQDRQTFVSRIGSPSPVVARRWHCTRVRDTRTVGGRYALYNKLRG